MGIKQTWTFMRGDEVLCEVVFYAKAQLPEATPDDIVSYKVRTEQT